MKIEREKEKMREGEKRRKKERKWKEEEDQGEKIIFCFLLRSQMTSKNATPPKKVDMREKVQISISFAGLF